MDLFTGLFECGWAIGLKYTDGFTKLTPSVLTIGAMAISIWLLSITMKTIPVGTAYPVWTGIGAVGVAILGMVLFSESRELLRILCLLLYCLRGLTDITQWNQRYLKVSFWSLNIGLAMMTFLSLLPQGPLQTYASIEHGYAYARSAEFVHSRVMEALVWMRVPGDVVFSVGVFAFVIFVFKATMASRKTVDFRGQADL